MSFGLNLVIRVSAILVLHEFSLVDDVFINLLPLIMSHKLQAFALKDLFSLKFHATHKSLSKSKLVSEELINTAFLISAIFT